MTSYEIERSLVHLAKEIIKTFGEETEVLNQKSTLPYIKDKMISEMIEKWYIRNEIKGELTSYGGEYWIGLQGEDENGSVWKIELRTENINVLIYNQSYSLTELTGYKAQ